jgi:hypothetical protein
MRSIKDYLKVKQRIFPGRFCISIVHNLAIVLMPAANGSKAGSFRGIYGKCGISVAPE